MPLGWYLAQGLVPLGPSSSDDEEGPCELPNGRIVCGPHGHVICGRCCSDYTGMGESKDDDSFSEDEDMEEYKPTVGGSSPGWSSSGPPVVEGLSSDFLRGTGRVFPTKFFPLSGITDPMQLFSGRTTFRGMTRQAATTILPNLKIDAYTQARSTRITHQNDPKKVLLLTDGACINNGQPNPKAGWAFQQGFITPGHPAVVAGALEKRGPFDTAADPVRTLTSNRAELRAIIAALSIRYWPGEGFDSLVIATDSAYAVDGATKHVKTWVKNGWQTAGRTDVKNRDLWEALLGRVERLKDGGLTVHFWHIPREWNVAADAAAKEAAVTRPAEEMTQKVFGVACF